MSTYSEYFTFDPKTYHPEINPESRKAVRWQDTFPHETFITLLKRAERMLARANNMDKHSIWIQGAYGTGKSRIAWTLSNILTCSPEELKEYFATYDDLKGETDLLNKLLGHKSGKIVVAERYKSDNINSPEDLVSAVYESLTEAFDERNCEYASDKTIRGGIIKTLDDEDARRYFEAIIKREPWKYEGCFAGKTGDEIVAILKTGGENSVNLVRQILRVSKAEGFPKIKFDANDLVAWIKETIARNHITSLILVWDEFSEFFKNNKTRMGSFQELTELQDSTPFNFVIVTHFSGSIFTEKELASANIVIDRFKPQTEIRMPESIAFKLIGHILKVKEALKEDWDMFAGDLNSRMEWARKKVGGYLRGVSEQDFKKMLPLHPYAALVLKNIAELFDSNQRSMFKFIADESEDARAFQWFVRTKSPEDGDVLSVDMLWDYFYETGKGRSGAGRSNLDVQVGAIMDVYQTQATKLRSDEQRVLKTILILQALAKKMKNQPEFLTTEENLRAAFEGIDDLDNHLGINLAKKLVSDKILFIDEVNGQRVFQAPMQMQGRDGEEIEKQKNQILTMTRTRDLLQDVSVDDILLLPPALKTMRYDVRLASPETFRTVLGQLINEDSRGYKVKAILVLARSRDDAPTVNRCIVDATRDSRAGSIAFIDASCTNMDDEDLGRWAEAKAKANYYLTKDSSQSSNALLDANSIRSGWIGNVRDGAFRYHAPKDPIGISCPRGNDVIDNLSGLVRRTFPLTLDFTPGLTEACFKTANKTSVLAGVLGGRENLPPRTSCVVGDQQEKALLEGAKGVERYWTKNFNLPISKLKRTADAMIARAFEPGAEGKIAIGEIVDKLIANGFMPTNLSAFLTGWLLKEYANDEYRYTDGTNNTGVMSSGKLVEMITNYFGKLNGTIQRYTPEYIEKLTEEQRTFVELSKEVFCLQDASSIERVASQIISRVKEFRYPLWCFDVLQETVAGGLEEFIEKYTQILNPLNAKGANAGTIATEIGRMAVAAPQKKNLLRHLFTIENAENAMRQWLGEFKNGELLTLAQEVHAQDLLADIRRCFDLEHVWLWDRAKGEEEIEKVLRDYKIVAESIRRGFVTTANSIDMCLEAWRDVAKSVKIPFDTLVTVRRDLKEFLMNLRDIARGGLLEESFKRDRFLAEITERGDLLQEFLEGIKDLFRRIYKVQLDGLSTDEQIALYKSLDTSSFVTDKTTYEAVLRQKVEDLKSQQERQNLLRFWKEHTGTESPREWSRKYETPILLMVPEEAFEDAKSAFAAVDERNTSSEQARRALETLERRSEILKSVSDSSKVDEAFRERALGKYAVVLSDLVEVRTKLKSIIGEEVYTWVGNPAFQKTIRDMAQSEYQAKKARDLGKKIDSMSPEKAKSYLKELVVNQFEVGIEILLEE